MDEQIMKILAGISANDNKTRKVTVSFTATEFHQLQAYCAQRYLSLSEVVRTAVVTLTNDTE